MSAVVIGVISFAFILGGTILGLLLRKTLPGHHLTGDSRDVLKAGSSLIATLSALVLALLLSSANNSFDQMNSGLIEGSTKLIMLDRTMAHYGPQTEPIRKMLRDSVMIRIATIWPEHKSAIDELDVFEKGTLPVEIVLGKLLELTPQTDAQRTFQSEALQLCKEILQIRWLAVEQAQSSLPRVFLGVLLFWLVIFFVSIGLLAPPNKTIFAILIICAVSVSSAIFLIEEMNKPLQGLVKISSGPIIKAFENMGK